MGREEGIEALSVLTHKRTEEFSGGAFAPYEVLPDDVRTSYLVAREDLMSRSEWSHQPARLGLGYVQAVLAVLSGCIQSYSYDPPGMKGRIAVVRGDLYHLSWNDEAKPFCMYGGFPNGIPNYLVAVLGIAQSMALFLCGNQIQSQEFIANWEALLHQMELSFPRNGRATWDKPQIEQACRAVETRRAILRVCDSLRAVMQYHLASSQDQQKPVTRVIRIFDDHILAPYEGTMHMIEGRSLLDTLQDLASVLGQRPQSTMPTDATQTDSPPHTNVLPILSTPLSSVVTGQYSEAKTQNQQQTPANNRSIGEGSFIGTTSDIVREQEGDHHTIDQNSKRVLAPIERAEQGQSSAHEHTQSLPISPLIRVVKPRLPDQSDPSQEGHGEEALHRPSEGTSPATQLTFYLSPSALMTALACEHRYGLKYIQHIEVPLSAAAWFGSIAHHIVERACYGMPLRQSHGEIWHYVCPSIADELQAWLPLELEYRTMLAAQREEKIRGVVSAWHTTHPDYRILKKQIQEYQENSLSHLHWYNSASLTDYYRRSAMLYMVAPAQVVLDNLVLVEGAWLPPPNTSALPPIKIMHTGERAAQHEQSEDEQEQLKGPLLECVIGGIVFRGRPDYVAFATNGEVLLADLKTGKRKTKAQLERDLQVGVYREMLWQNNIAARSQPIRSGHIYLTEDGVDHLWDDGILHGGPLHQQVLRRIAFQARLLAKRRAAGELQPVYGTPHEVCSRCDYAEVCEWVQAA